MRIELYPWLYLAGQPRQRCERARIFTEDLIHLKVPRRGEDTTTSAIIDISRRQPTTRTIVVSEFNRIGEHL